MNALYRVSMHVVVMMMIVCVRIYCTALIPRSSENRPSSRSQRGAKRRCCELVDWPFFQVLFPCKHLIFLLGIELKGSLLLYRSVHARCANCAYPNAHFFEYIIIYQTFHFALVSDDDMQCYGARSTTPFQCVSSRGKK